MASSVAPLICPAPRISWACDSCRSKRQRCLPSDKAGVCERCWSNRATCAFTHRDDQKKRAASRKAESKPRGPPTNTYAPVPTGSIPSLEPSHIIEPDLLSTLFPHAKPVEAKDQIAHFTSSHRSMISSIFSVVEAHPQKKNMPCPRAQSPIPRDCVSLYSAVAGPSPRFDTAQMEASLQKYREGFSYFPFFPLLDDIQVDSLCKDRPFFLLGLLCSTNADYPLGYHRLDMEFRRVFGDRVINDSETSIDLAQGALLHIARFPIWLYPKGRLPYTYLRITNDLLNGMDLEELLQAPETASQSSRTYLACFYLTSLVATSSPNSKHVLMRPSLRYVEHCLHVLEADPVGPDSQHLVQLVRTQKMAEQAFNLSRAFASSIGSMTTAKTELESIGWYLRNTVPVSQMSNTLLLTHHFAQVLAHSADVDMRRSRRRGTPTKLEPPDILNTGDTSLMEWRHKNLELCLEAGKDFLETLLAISLNEYRHFTFVETCRIVKVIILMCYLCFPLVKIPAWDDVAAREKTKFGMLLECLCYRMQQLSNENDKPCESTDLPLPPNLFCLFHSALRIVKENYDSKLVLRQKELLVQSNELDATTEPWTFGCPMLDGNIQNTPYWSLLDQSDWEFFASNATSSSLSTDQFQPPSAGGVTLDDWITPGEDSTGGGFNLSY